MTALFERSFRRALLFAIIESEETLRDFFGPEHEERIERFRKLESLPHAVGNANLMTLPGK